MRAVAMRAKFVFVMAVVVVVTVFTTRTLWTNDGTRTMVVSPAMPSVDTVARTNSPTASSVQKKISDVPRSIIKERGVEQIDNTRANTHLLFFKNMYQRNSQLDVNPNDPSTVTKFWHAAAMIDWYLAGPLRHQCKNRVAMGNWNICQDPPYTIAAPCLVYSFGINWDFSFDDAMGQLGCEVHSFDPSMLNETDHQRGTNVHFHKLGLGSEDTGTFDARRDIYVLHQQTWQMKTLKTIMKELGHENRVIDVLKIDIEGYEWNVTQNILQTDLLRNVRQFLIEFHLMETWPRWDEYLNAFKALTEVRSMGFREFFLFRHTRILQPSTVRVQGDCSYVNSAFQRTVGVQ